MRWPAADTDLQARAREIAAGLTKAQRERVQHETFAAYGGSERRCAYNLQALGLFAADATHWEPFYRTDLGRAVAAVLAEGEL